MPSKTSAAHMHSHKNTSSPIHTYHSNVMQAMCTQMVHHRRAGDIPLPLARKPVTASPSTTTTKQPGFTQHVQEEMARRVKADRVLQDLSSDKSRQLARQRETNRRSKWAKNVANAVPPSEVPVIKKQMAQHKAYDGSKRRNPQVV